MHTHVLIHQKLVQSLPSICTYKFYKFNFKIQIYLIGLHFLPVIFKKIAVFIFILLVKKKHFKNLIPIHIPTHIYYDR